ncbi:unnamed protein product [Clonostachys rosea]|uniref:RING-type domain-containing protein n=1 Tax=Bionectria ochroleuca TaxID=29856 RepID=A0ABY6UTE6_BIOOC|nr:unnamed protein product [Clonostachys rosea]
MSSQTSAQASRVERQHNNRTLGGNAPTNRVRVEGHSRRAAPWSARAGQAIYRATGGSETYMDIASTKPPPSKRALLSLEEVEISELPEDERTCIICYNDFGDECPEGHAETPRRLPKCKHIFGDRCIKKWLEESDNCPYCRDRVGRVRASDLTMADFAEVPREPSDDQPDELLDTFLRMSRSQLRNTPIYSRLHTNRTPEERERQRVWLLQTREAQLRESAESPSRSPVEREDVLVTPPPRAPSDMDPTIQTPSHIHRNDVMATPPSTIPHLAAQQGSSAPTLPEQNPNIPRPGPMGGNSFGGFGTNSSTQTISPSPESPHANPVQNIPTMAEFTSASLIYDSQLDQAPRDVQVYLPALNSRGRPGRGRRC